MLTRKHFQIVADAMTEVPDDGKLTKGSVVGLLCLIFSADNARFDADKFVEACTYVKR